MFVRNSEYITQPFCSADWCLVAAWREGATASAQARVKAEQQRRGKQVWEGIFSHKRLQTARSGRGKPDKAMYPRPDTWGSLKANTASDSKQRRVDRWPRAQQHGAASKNCPERCPCVLRLKQCPRVLSPERYLRVLSPERYLCVLRPKRCPRVLSPERCQKQGRSPQGC